MRQLRASLIIAGVAAVLIILIAAIAAPVTESVPQAVWVGAVLVVAVATCLIVVLLRDPLGREERRIVRESAALDRMMGKIIAAYQADVGEPELTAPLAERLRYWRDRRDFFAELMTANHPAGAAGHRQAAAIVDGLEKEHAPDADPPGP
ncbi:hypothetical protein [Microlunatus parietis]|uniref:Uncharacterized protein n=1 Tax=Microlunatus parietis TaxID=682979 RepID=A0A7Y9IBH7_9ACTN|nr:hypothetical protein [Microlunatus parietis]NYE73878.1 hypothetical protein [Microlunatus parietis]